MVTFALQYLKGATGYVAVHDAQRAVANKISRG